MPTTVLLAFLAPPVQRLRANQVSIPVMGRACTFSIHRCGNHPRFHLMDTGGSFTWDKPGRSPPYNAEVNRVIPILLHATGALIKHRDTSSWHRTTHLELPLFFWYTRSFMCPTDNKLYREMTSGYLNGQYCGPLPQYWCTCFNATRLPLYWAPLHFSRAVKKYLGDSVFNVWPWRWRQRNYGKFKSRKTNFCHRFYDLWFSTSTLFLAETSNCNIHCHNNKKRSRNA